MKEGGRPIFPSQLRAPKQRPPPSPVTLGSRDRAAAKSSKEITVSHEGKWSTECSRQALYLQDCQIPQNKFLRERAAMGEGREEERILPCHSDTEVTLCRALPATQTHPLFLPEQQTWEIFQLTSVEAEETKLPELTIGIPIVRMLTRFFDCWVLWAFHRKKKDEEKGRGGERGRQREKKRQRDAKITTEPHKPDLLFLGLLWDPGLGTFVWV